MWLTLLSLLFFLACLGVILTRHFKAIQAINFYERQGGVTVYPGARTFFLGNTALVGKWEQLRLESS